ncbi:MAG: hypothetical protein Q9207_004196 [Kuettlingeria erythrocarpa]
MTDYHFELEQLEFLVQARSQLIARGSVHWGTEKSINFRLAQLHDANSLPSAAEDYCRRLKIIRQQLGGFAMWDMDDLITTQEAQVGIAKPNTGKRRSPKFSPPPVVKPSEKPKVAAGAKAPSPFAWNNAPSAPANARVSTAAPAPQPVPTPVVPGGWPATNHQPSQPIIAPAQGEATVAEPPALHISILRMRGIDKGKHFKYRNKLRHASCDIKIGGLHYVDDYSGFTHPLLAKPSKIGTVQWSQKNALVILKSSDYLPHVRGSTVHIQAYSKEDAQSLVNHLTAWYAKEGVRIVEIPSKNMESSWGKY